MRPPQLSRFCRLAFAATVLLILGAWACQAPAAQVRQPLNVPACDAGLCNITDAAWNHINDRHCQGCVANDKSGFIAAYCGSKANAVTFCQTLMGRASCVGALQPNGRVKYTATFAAVVGDASNNNCNNTTQGVVIYDPNTMEVVTQFPE